MINKITKVDAIRKVMRDNNGIINWNILYNEIEKYYPNAKNSKEWKAGIRGVLYREINNNKNFKKIEDGYYALLEYQEEELILPNEDIIGNKQIITEVTREIKTRKGQNIFRNNLLKTVKKCPITQINDKRLLIASHIKPWKLSNNFEKLDPYNGFLLSATFDKLFDQGLITFNFDKKLIISNNLSLDNIKYLKIENNQLIKDLPLKNREHYLEFHQKKIFIKN